MNTTKVWLGKRHFINTPPEFQRFKNVNGKLVRRNLSKDEERQELDWWNIKQSSIRRDNVYVYWYEFLKQSTKYKKVCDSEGKEGSTDLKKLYKDFGNVHIKTFRQWWRESDRGAFLFAEQSPEHKITEITHLDQLHLDEEFMNIQIPLSFSQRDIARLVYELVNKRHKGQRGKRKTEITSTAKYKVSGRVDFGRLEKTLAVYYLVKSEKNKKNRNDKKPYWHIAWELRHKHNISLFKNDDSLINPDDEKKRREDKNKERLSRLKRKKDFIQSRQKNIYTTNIYDFEREFAPKKSYSTDFDAKRNKIDATMSRYCRDAEKLIKSAESGKFPNLR